MFRRAALAHERSAGVVFGPSVEALFLLRRFFFAALLRVLLYLLAALRFRAELVVSWTLYPALAEVRAICRITANVRRFVA
ncbi:MAG: hypothetical protein WKF95_16585 [Rubrobacter sp.]